MSTASKKQLSELHALLSSVFTTILTKAQGKGEDEGDGLQAAMANAIRQFLRDNGIEASRSVDPDEASPFDELIDAAKDIDRPPTFN